MVAITKEEFLQRFYKKFPEENIEILEYSAVSRPIRIKCNYCGKRHYYGTGDQLLASFNCCQQQRKENRNKIEKIYGGSKDFELVKWIDPIHIVIKHRKCGTQMRRLVESCLKEPYRCRYCEMEDQFAPETAEEARAQLNNKFHGSLSLLEYKKGENSIYKCNNCGFEFNYKHAAVMLSHGCPRCKK